MRPFFDQISYDFLMRQLDRPYIWGGQTPLLGWDCSGLCVEFLRLNGQVPGSWDATSQGIFDYFEKGRACYSTASSFGALIFYGKSITRISHVGIGLDLYRMVEAGGGGPRIKTPEDAIQADARVRIRPVDNRDDRVAILKPYYRTIGAI